MNSVYSKLIKCFNYKFFIVLFIVLDLFYFVSQTQLDAGDHCFCKLKGQIGDCSCNVDTVDHFNNIKVYPRLRSILNKDYFRFYKVNLRKECPFWTDDSRCAMRFCHVKPCREDDIPPGLKGESNNHNGEHAALKYLENSQNSECEAEETDEELGYLNMTISASAYKEFELWKAHDDAQDNFCTLPDEDGDAQYVDLLLNPERYTGYKGPSAHRIWRSIYMENCFRPKNIFAEYIPSSKLNGLCLEKRVFYRVVSGLHASINIHLSSQFLFQSNINFGELSKDSGEVGNWGPNLAEFKKRFSPEYTGGEGPEWLRNLYFLYLLELRAVAKAGPYLVKEQYYTGNDSEDADTRMAMHDILSVIRSFPDHFNESSMFSGGKEARKLKEDFRQHFRNISRIMDCVGCEKCKLWGKLQIQGLGTALKILFSGKFDKLEINKTEDGFTNEINRNFRLQRSEIVALFNALGRLSTSIYEIENFRQMMR
ncbi:hypothetical protein O3M35_011075 [Rhynocoris fuscipes]|uniref:Ero1-like protein n=1 Tax=Rhynocoris fuscipes TaxID=488301 RepID=A0AAW1CUY1_9HEMI